MVLVSVSWANITGFTVTGGGTNSAHGGIELSNVNNCSVSNNYVTGNGRDGIRLLNTLDSTVEDNIIENNGDEGIHIQGSSRNSILNNTIFNHLGGGFGGGIADGILIYQSSNDNIVSGNNVTNNEYGIEIQEGADRNLIVNNVISDHIYGIYLQNSNQNNLTFNTMTNNGIFIFGNQYSHWDSHDIDTSNTANGKPVYYWKFQSSSTIPAGAGQVLLINCSDITIDSQDVSNATVGVELGYSVNTTISGVNASNGVYGFYIYVSDGTNITGCDAFQNSVRGIYLGFSTANNVTNSNSIGNGIGILLREITWTNVAGNTVSNSAGGGFNTGDGIVLESSSHYNTILGNVVTFNADDGIYLRDANANELNGNTVTDNTGDGIYLRDAFLNELIGNNVSQNLGDGIYFRNADDNNITNNEVFMNQDDGIYLRTSDNNNLTGNEFSLNLGDGIYILSSSQNTLLTNDAFNNRYGINFDSSSQNTLLGNNASYNRYGFYFDSSSQNILDGNNASYNDCGIFLYLSSYIDITATTMIRNGIFIDQGNLQHWNTHVIDTSNTVNGKPVYYWKNQTMGAVPVGAGQVILANCTSVDITSTTTTLGTVGIELGFSWTNTLIANNASSNNWYGIYLYSSDDNLIWGNTASFNGESGIHIGYSTDNTLTSNPMELDGIWIEGNLIGHWNTQNIDTANNVNGKPVYYLKDQSGGVVPSDGGEIILANCSNMEISGSELTFQTVGIEMGFSMNITIHANNLSNNRFGIYVYNSDQNTIMNNTVSYNTEYGIQLVMSDVNLIYHNNIIENTNQAFDDRATNDWNEIYSISGNYWSDYTGPDLYSGPLQNLMGSDGIGDVANPIDGNSIDFYPLINPWDYTGSIPTEPQNLLASAGNTFVNLTWNPPANDGGYPVYAYRIYRNTTSGTEVFYFESGSDLFFNDTTVVAGVTYFYMITAVTIIGEGPFSNEASDKPYSEPSEPLGLLLVASGNSFVNLTWSPPATDGGFPITNYTIYRGETPGFPTYIIEIGNLTSFNDTTAINGITYYYNITAKNSVGEGPKSSEVSATPVSIPGPPLNLITQEGDSFVNVTWNPPLDDGGSPITNYYIYRGDVPWVYQIVPAGQLWFNDSSLTNGVTYTYNITAVNAIGEGPNSTEVSATPMTVPSVPQSLQGIVGDTLVNLTWLSPANDGGSPITGYRIYKGTQPGNLTLLNETGNILFYEDTNVTNGNTYYYVVRAINIVGEGSPSLEIPATPATVPGAPTGLAANTGDSFVELSWNAPSSDGGSSIIEYVIYISTTSGSGFIVIANSNSLNFNDTGVSNGVEYFYVVTARNVIGEGPISNEASDTPLGSPSPPENVDAVSGESYVYISWEVPTSDGGSTITKYLIYRGTTSGDLVYLDDAVGILYFNDTTGLDGTEYFYKVTAVNVIGESAQSGEVSGLPFAYPGIPLNVNAISGDTYIYISWDQPDSVGSSAITNYVIYRGTTSQGETYLTEIGSVLFYNDTSVTRGETYFYYIVAKNSEGPGPKSAEVNGTATSVPDYPENVLEDAGDSYVQLSWDAPDSDGGLAITNYRIYRRTASGVDTLIEEIGNLLSYNDTGVTNGITYYYKIAAVNAIGESTRSNEILSLPSTDTDLDGQPDHVDDDDDDDGLLDSEELDKGTDPLKADSDGDGHNDKEDLFPLDSSKWKEEEEPESSNLIWILLILIIIIVVVLVLFLATRKKGKPKEETVPEGEKKELPPPPGKVKEEGSEGEQEDSTPGDEEPKEEEKLGAEEPEFEAESKEEAQDEISSEEPKVDESIEQESQKVEPTSEESTLDEPKEEILNEPELNEEDLPPPED